MQRKTKIKALRQRANWKINKNQRGGQLEGHLSGRAVRRGSRHRQALIQRLASSQHSKAISDGDPRRFNERDPRIKQKRGREGFMHRGFARDEKSRVLFFFLVSEHISPGTGAGRGGGGVCACVCVCVNDEGRGGGREGGGSEELI